MVMIMTMMHCMCLSSCSSGDEDEATAEDSGALGEVVERMQALATNKAEESYRRSKRDKATTKAAFRDLWKVVQVSLKPKLLSEGYNP